MAEAAGLVLAVPGVISLLCHYGQKLYQKIQDHKRFEDVVQQLRLFEIPEKRMQLEIDIQLAQKVLKSPNITPDHKSRLNGNFNRIVELIQRMDDLVEAVGTNTSIFSKMKNKAARNDLKDIGSTGKLSNAVMEFHTVVTSLRMIETDESPDFLQHQDFTVIDSRDRQYGPNRDVFLCKGRLTHPTQTVSTEVSWFLHEQKEYTPSTKDAVKQDVRELAQKLSQAQPGNGILPLLGFRGWPNENGQEGAFELIFHGNLTRDFPATLSSSYRTQPRLPSLNYRMGICYQLASAVLQTHTLGLVHKNIRPDNIILINTGDGGDPTLFLIGWQYARRSENPVTFLHGDTSIEKKIYRHSARQAPLAERAYTMADDIYSLGVCMLEVLTWKPLIVPGRHSRLSEQFWETFHGLDISDDSQSIGEEDGSEAALSPGHIQRTLVRMSEEYVPAMSGMKMALLIKSMLTHLDDEDRNDFKVTVEKNNREVALEFVDGILKVIRDIQTII
ncbi:hypothetical protein BFW01_g9978 [Lasiodiplodia theobromae]|uniref:Het-s domain protein n=1 Tax=Lasiodiplodia theobromae TaxID=45133 RepID=UPI0015C394FB|nr:Het-s domain protein [Lasiodiplodia theobromae]KAF4545343.1 Het-s domain protein [Lasiodiplodia theobromae]KAF9639081.1 hypothetical protein BFW01_g9978 [Lasiodiplodia theobromae]